MKITNNHSSQHKKQNLLSREAPKTDEKSSYKYKLVGAMVKIMLIKNGVEVSCIKSIPVKNAPPEVIAKIENLTFADMVMINDLQNEQKHPQKNDDNLPKEHIEYEKHLIYETDL